MSDVSTRSAAPAPPPQTSAPPSSPSRRDDRVGAEQGDAFQAALRDVRGRDEDEEAGPRGPRRGEDDKRKGKKGQGEASTAAALGHGLAEGLARFGFVHAKAQQPGDYSDMSGLPQHAGGLAAAEAPAEPEAAGAVDPAAFAKMVDAAAAQAQAVAPGQTLRVEFTDLQSPLQGVEIQRAPDGALSFALNASADQVTEVSKSLQALRRRLEARGLDVAEVTLAGEADGLAPVHGGGLG